VLSAVHEALSTTSLFLAPPHIPQKGLAQVFVCLSFISVFCCRCVFG
jgi:hypothetical protein